MSQPINVFHKTNVINIVSNWVPRGLAPSVDANSEMHLIGGTGADDFSVKVTD